MSRLRRRKLQISYGKSWVNHPGSWKIQQTHQTYWGELVVASSQHPPLLIFKVFKALPLKALPMLLFQSIGAQVLLAPR